MDTIEKINVLNEIVQQSKFIVFFGGAGVSTESGIPDFRSKDGLYNSKDIQFEKYQPEYLLSHDCLYHRPAVFYEFYKQKMDVRNFEPNITHKKLAEMEQKGLLSGIITQNIDGLHQKAGSKNVFEIHGTARTCHCANCGTKYDGNYIFDYHETIPICDICGGVVRPDVVLYGEPLPTAAWDGAMNLVEKADCLIIGGTSLSVYPAAELIDYIVAPSVIIINRDPTPMDKWADLVFNDSLGNVFSQIKT